MTASCLYAGTIRHRRYAVRHREFRHSLTLAYLDLDELPTLLDGRLIRGFPGLLRFRRGDYLGDGNRPLTECVRDTVEAQTGVRPEGQVRVLTHLRTFGHCFNPVSFYYCYEGSGDGVEAVIAEVTNTPWRERHGYVLSHQPASGPIIEARFDKRLHVSPFMAMDHAYRARLTAPGPTLSAHIESHRHGELEFDATLALRRVELTRASAGRLLVRYPFSTIRVLGLIYAHALKLWLTGVPGHPHPGRDPA